MTDYYLAVDAGGSRCRALLADETGNLLRQAEWHNSDCTGRLGAGRSAEAVSDTLSKVLEGFAGDRIICGTNCSDTETVRLASPFITCPIEAEHYSEFESALALSGMDYGYVCLSGTGAGSMAIRRGSAPVLLDGLGPGAADFGGGWRIGKKAVEAAIKSTWAPEYRTALEKPVNLLITGEEDSRRGLEYVPVMLRNPDRSLVASAAKIVTECAEQGDTIAINILRTAAEELADTLRCLIKYAAPDPEPLPVICTGSVVNSPIVARFFDEICGRILPEHEIIHMHMPQAAGLLLLAAKQMKSREEYRAFFTILQNQRIEFE